MIFRGIFVWCLLCGMVFGQGRGNEPPPAPPQVVVPVLRTLLKAAEEGEYLKYTQSATENGKTQSATLWQVYEGSDEQVATLRMAMTQRANPPDAPPTAPEPDIQAGAQKVPLNMPVLSPLPTPQGAKVTQQTVTLTPHVQVTAAGKTFDCECYTMTTVFTAIGAELKVVQNAYLCPEVPLTHVVKLDQTVTGAREQSSSMVLQAFGKGNPVTPLWFALRGVDAAGQVKRLFDEGQRNDYLKNLNQACLAGGQFEAAEQVMAKLTKDTARDYAKRDYEAAVVWANDPAAMAKLKLTPKDLDSRLLSYLGARRDVAASAPLEPLVARLTAMGDTEVRAQAWQSLFLFNVENDKPDRAKVFYDHLADEPARNSALVKAPGFTKAEKLPALYAALGQPAAPTYRIQLDMYLTAGKKAEASALVEPYLAVIGKYEDPLARLRELSGLDDLLGPTGDPHLLAIRQQVASLEDAQAAALQQQVDKGFKDGYVYPFGCTCLAERLLRQGKVAEAQALFAANPKFAARDQLEAVAACYRHGLAEQAVQWAKTLTGGPKEAAAAVDATRANLYLEFAKFEAARGQAEAAASWLGQATTLAVAVDQAIAASGAEATNLMYLWQNDFGHEYVPFCRIVRDLIAHGKYAEAMALLKQLPDHGKDDSTVANCYRAIGVAAGLAGQAGPASEAFLKMPTGDHRTYIDNTLDIVTAMTRGGHGTEALEVAMKSPMTLFNDRERFLAAVCFEEAAQGHGDAARAAMQKLAGVGTRNVAERDRLVDGCLVAIARAEAKAKNAAAARDTYLKHRQALGDTLQVYGFNGAPADTIVCEAGMYAADAGLPLAELAAWYKQIPDPREQAYFALGVVLGQAHAPAAVTKNMLYQGTGLTETHF